MEKKRSLWSEFTKGIIKENPVLRLVLGCCATLAVSTSASNAIGMGLATTFVLVCSNAAISLLRKVILLIPLILLLPRFLSDQVFAVFLAEPVADILAATTTGAIFFWRLPRILEKRRLELEHRPI